MNLEVFTARYIQPPIDRLAAEIRAERAAFQALVEAFIHAQGKGKGKSKAKRSSLGAYANGSDKPAQQ